MSLTGIQEVAHGQFTAVNTRYGPMALIQSAPMSDLQQIIAPYVGTVGGTISAMHALNREYGYISEGASAALAEAFNISRAEVRGIVSFYSDFRTSPKPKNVLRICQAEACQSVGTRELTAQIEKRTGLKLGDETSQLGIEAVYCLGLCTHGPAVMYNDQLIAKATDDLIAATLEDDHG